MARQGRKAIGIGGVGHVELVGEFMDHHVEAAPVTAGGQVLLGDHHRPLVPGLAGAGVLEDMHHTGVIHLFHLTADGLQRQHDLVHASAGVLPAFGMCPAVEQQHRLGSQCQRLDLCERLGAGQLPVAQLMAGAPFKTRQCLGVESLENRQALANCLPRVILRCLATRRCGRDSAGIGG